MRHSLHLPILASGSSGADSARRWMVLGLTVAVLALWTAAYFLPWWSFTLFAPQYPHGLTLSVSLTGIGGDLREIDMLNHYIGMGHLEDAAPYERALGPYGLGALALLVVLFAVVGGRRFSAWLWVPAVALLACFLGDSFYWLHRYGHHLNPKAPLHIAPFTPHLIGPGTIGQFHTTAAPALGFALAFASLALLVTATVVRSRVCRDCSLGEGCHLVCPRLLVAPRRP
jgi:hypothetical protein